MISTKLCMYTYALANHAIHLSGIGNKAVKRVPENWVPGY